MHSIRPCKEDDSDSDMDIELKDFITIFKNDEVSDNVIKMINEEVNYRKKVQKMRQNKKIDYYDSQCSDCNPPMEPGTLSISMKSEFNDIIEDSQESQGEV